LLCPKFREKLSKYSMTLLKGERHASGKPVDPSELDPGYELF
jgi:hypothetical protein